MILGGYPMANKGFVKILIIVLLLSMIVLPLISAVISADDGNMILFNFLDETEDTLESRIFYNKEIMLAGSALENTEITVNKYWYKAFKDKSIVFKDGYDFDCDEGEWISQKEYTRTVGASGIFAIPIKINAGKYKIEVIAKKDNNINEKEIEIEYNDKGRINEEFRLRIFRDFNLSL